MKKGTKMPGMSQCAYNTWLLNTHNSINGCVDNFKLNRDGFKKDYMGQNSEWWKTCMYVFKPKPICGPPELVIVKTKRVNCNPAHINLSSRLCKQVKYDWLAQ